MLRGHAAGAAGLEAGGAEEPAEKAASGCFFNHRWTFPCASAPPPPRRFASSRPPRQQHVVSQKGAWTHPFAAAQEQTDSKAKFVEQGGTLQEGGAGRR